MHRIFLTAWFSFVGTIALVMEFVQVRVDPTITAGQIGEAALFAGGLLAAWLKLRGSVEVLKEGSERQREMHEENSRRLNKLESLTERVVALQESEDARLARLENRLDRLA